MTAAVGLLFLVFFCLLAIGVPVLGSIGLGVIANSLMGGAVSLAYIGRNMVQALDSFTVLAVPLFILAGEIMGQGGISKSFSTSPMPAWENSLGAFPWRRCLPVCCSARSPAPVRLLSRRWAAS